MFLTVSRPINAVFASFPSKWFGFLTTKKKTRENSAVLSYPKKKKRKTYKTCLTCLSSTAITPNLCLSIDRRFLFLNWKRQFSSKHRAMTMASRGREMYVLGKRFELSASDPWNGSFSWWTTDWLRHTARWKSPQQGWTGEKSTDTKLYSQG